MTSDETVTAARDFLARRAYPVEPEPEAVRRMAADRFYKLFGRPVYPSDFWVVEFRKLLPPGVAAETPGTVAVEVTEATGQVRKIYVGMWGDDGL